MPIQNLACYKCQHTWQSPHTIGRRDECPKCGHDAHICLNCSLYEKNAHHECREPQADFVAHKDKANFCDYFVPKHAHEGGQNSQNVKAQLDALFSKSPDLDPDKPKSNLEEELQKYLSKKN